MLVAIALGAFLPILLVTTLSLAARRWHPGVGAVAGGMVIALLLIAVIVSLYTVFAPQPDELNLVFAASETERRNAVILGLWRMFLAIGLLVLLACAIGWIQSRLARLPLGIAIMGGFAEIAIAGIAWSYLMWEAFVQGNDPLFTPLKWILGAEWLVAEVVAALLVRRLKFKRGFSNGREAPHEYAAF